MIIDSKSSLLNKQSAGKRPNGRETSDRFEDMLQSATKKHKPAKKIKKTEPAKKKQNSPEVAESQTEKRVDSQPKKIAGQSRRPQNQAGQSSVASTQVENSKGGANGTHFKNEPTGDGKSVGSPEVLPSPLSGLSLTEEGGALPMSDGSKNLNAEKKATNDLVSLNLSGNEKNTLAKNEKILSKMENQFSQMMSQTKAGTSKPQSQSQFLGLNQVAPQQNVKTGSGGIDIDGLKPVDLSTNGLSIGEGAGPLAVALPESGQEASDFKDSGTDLESMISQMVEQDSGTSEAQSLNFTEEIGLGQGEKSQSKIENMQSIIKQARAFVDDGGGTMEIHLQPEGLGKVHLKVAVDNGQVNVEMMADNVLAKRALEEGLLDIKTALEGQKLLVETLKVEMSPDYQKDFSDMSNHSQEQENRDFAQQFLGQFKQGREERMGGMFDAFRNFQRGPSQPELSLSSRNPYTENGKGRTLNLVA